MQQIGKKPFSSIGKETYEGPLASRSLPAGEEYNFMLCRSFTLFLLFSSCMVGQSVDTRKTATVHVYQQGRLLVAVSVFADGNRVVALTPHKSATFYLVPGYHELTMPSGEISPTAQFKAEAGREYFFQLDYEQVAPAASLRDLSLTLTMQPGMKGADELREVTIDPGKLLELLSHSNPDGLEPGDPILTDANAHEQAAAVPRR